MQPNPREESGVRARAIMEVGKPPSNKREQTLALLTYTIRYHVEPAFKSAPAVELVRKHYGGNWLRFLVDIRDCIYAGHVDFFRVSVSDTVVCGHVHTSEELNGHTVPLIIFCG